MFNGGRVEVWTCVNFSTRLNRDVPFQFCQGLVDMCNSKGMQGKQLQMLIIILPDVSGSYGRIKRVCETELGIVGGRNTVLVDAVQKRIPLVTDRPTIIFGSDVTHPQPGEDSSPSIAAVVASMDWPEVTKYRGLVSAQAHHEEIIQDLYKSTQDPQRGLVHGGMIRMLLMLFHLCARDGVGEGQFSQVLLHEMSAIRQACASLEEGYAPPVTFVVVQKRHHTRLFPAEHNNRDLTDRSGNILPVPPAYYAHLAAFRARYYIEDETSAGGSTGGSRSTADRNLAIRPLPVIKDNVKDVKKALKGIKVVLRHMGYNLNCKITGITSQPMSQVMFTDGSLTEMSVVQYFLERHNIALQFTSLPALEAGTEERRIYLPMEMARKNAYNKDTLVNKEFGIQVADGLTSFDARILPAPMLKYHESGREASVNPDFGQWNMINKVKKALKGIKVVLRHMGYNLSCKITGITSQPMSQLILESPTPFEKHTLCYLLLSSSEIHIWFTCDNETRSVVQYFLEKHKIALQFTSLPALEAGTEERRIYLPMEMARENAYNEDTLVNREFGIQVVDGLTSVNARILPAPMLKYHETGPEASVNPDFGQWNMINKKMFNGGTVQVWTCMNFSTCLNQDVIGFCQRLVDMCNRKGMVFNCRPVIPISSYNPYQIEKALVDVHNKTTQPGKQLQLLIIILPDVSGSYGRIKRVCETELGIVSQCCQPKHASSRNMQYFENVALKINVKVGGRNTVLDDAVQKRIPLVTDRPTIIFGADVTHPQPGEDSSPSIAAVVASMDWPEVTKYRGLVSAQAHNEEIIQDLYKSIKDPQRGLVHGGMIRELLIDFRRSTNFKPHRIIFYRDGVSEGQFSQVLLHEMNAIRQACASIEEGYAPPVTFVVVQKRHHTRLFPAEYNRRDLTDRSGNILPGTVVDTQICHPKEFDFYLNSHAGIQGTSRPTHYHVLYDENRFTADDLQMLTNNLCYTYARCTRSVSIVPPAYYAHLAAFRARFYIEDETSAGGSTGGTRSTAEGSLAIRPLPVIKDNVKDVMFYC
ncbi:hypothetical protein CUMW_275360 [Citrus unshiu]|uniref:Piwi domain-containing protein n=1 Tax=Citrus unshiu TaxID=55188 RepID=A0A2H5MZS4_CITUN|nr:hypothetical protein CUMW_275360 [Citrus unshiu]